jgi:hypothetical protein
VPAQDCVGCEQRADFFQSLAPQNLALHRQTTSLVVVQQDAFLAEFLFQNLVLGSEVFDDFLLLTVHPAGQNHEVQLPRLQNEVHGRPEGWAKAFTMRLDWPLVNAGVSRELHLSPLVSHATDGSYMSAEYFDQTTFGTISTPKRSFSQSPGPSG